MTSQQTLAGLGHSNSNKLFEFTLSTKEDVPLKLKYTPDGWQDAELTFIRDPKYKGILKEFSTKELTFNGDGREFIQTAYERGGIDYVITITVKLQNNATFKYESYFVGKLDLSTYKTDSIGVTCGIINTGFQDAILNREDINVDLFNTKYIGGGAGSMAQITGMPAELTLDQYTAIVNADWGLGTTDPFPGTYISAGDFNHYVPMIVNSSEFLVDEAGNQEYYITTPFFTAINAIASRTIDITGTITVYFQSYNSGQLGDYEHELTIRKNATIVYQASISRLNTEIAQIDFTISESISVVPGDILTIQGIASGTVDYSFDYVVMNIDAVQDLGSSLPTVTIKSFPAFEFTARIIQLISGITDPLDSNELGRTDSLPQVYGSDGNGSLMTFTSGKLIREFDYTLETFNASLSGIFKTLNGLRNIGLGFETVGGSEKVKIEKEAYFYNISDNADYPATDTRPYTVNQILDLSGDVTDEILSKEVIPDLYANEIKSGYSDFEYEYTDGLKEFNTKSTYATNIISVKNTLDLQAEYRGDTQGVNKLREKPQSTDASEDVGGDNDTFLFDSKRAGSGWAAKTDEDFSYVSGGVDPDESYNLDFTPRRNLERHGNKIRSMLMDVGKEVQWMQSDKNTKLITRKTTESVNKAENEDITINDLTLGYWIPEAYVFPAPVNEATIAAILANPYGVFKVGTDKYGWILEVQTNNEDKKGEFRLLRVDLSNVKVIV